MDFSTRGREYLREHIFIGIVEENVDPKRQGRIKVRVQSVFDDLELEYIPWSSPYKDLAGKTFSVPGVGKIVNVIFPEGDLYDPYYIYAEKYNINLYNKLNGLSDTEYKNFIALLFDHRTQIYSDDSELRMDYMYNNIKIKENEINIHLKDNKQELHLGHDYANQSAVLGDHWMKWFDEFMSTLLQPQSLLGNLGAPILKPQLDQVILKYQALRKTFLSQHVKIVDNGSCLKTDNNRQDKPVVDDIVKIDNQKLLNSDAVPKETKEKVMDNRKEEAQKIEDNKPDKVDEIEYTESEGDSDTIDNIEVDERSKNIELSEDEQGRVDKIETIQERKSEPQTPVNVEEIYNFDDPYDSYWESSSADYEQDSFYDQSDIQSSPVMGDYTVIDGDVSSTDGKYTKSNVSNSVSNSKFDPNKAKTMKYKSKTVKNGQLSGDDLITISGRKDNNGRPIMFRDDAGKAFIRLEEAFKKEFGKNFSINSTYRDFNGQVKEKISAINAGTPKKAAEPGTSAHGWGLAFDFNTYDGKVKDWNSKYVKWMKTVGINFGWGQPSHWPYSFTKDGKKDKEAWHWQYFPEKDKYKDK